MVNTGSEVRIRTGDWAAIAWPVPPLSSIAISGGAKRTNGMSERAPSAIARSVS
jgi:hypothetical protein